MLRLHAARLTALFAALLLLRCIHRRRSALQVPRVALESTTFDDLLFYPAVPGKTIFLVSISKIAQRTGNLLYTFGTGDDVRACPFKPFFEKFMWDLQTQLRAGGKASSSTAKEL